MFAIKGAVKTLRWVLLAAATGTCIVICPEMSVSSIVLVC